jgi:hypothetical protein
MDESAGLFRGVDSVPEVIGAEVLVVDVVAEHVTDLADKTGLTSGFVQALGLDRVRRRAHEPGRVAVDLAVSAGLGPGSDNVVSHPLDDLHG